MRDLKSRVDGAASLEPSMFLSPEVVERQQRLSAVHGYCETVYSVARLLIGTLLLVAGIGKVAAFQPMILAARFVIPSWLTLALGIIEALLGIAVLTMIPSHRRWGLLAGLFAVFVGGLALNGFSGETVCKGFGGSGLSVWLMLSIDFLVLATLWIFRPKWVGDDVFRPSVSVVADLLANAKFVIPTLLIGAAIYFGSLESAYGYLRGRSLLADTSIKFEGLSLLAKMQLRYSRFATFLVNQFALSARELLVAVSR